MTNSSIDQIIQKKYSWCAWDSNPGNVGVEGWKAQTNPLSYSVRSSNFFLTCFFKNRPIPASFFVYFRSLLVTISIQIEKSVDGVLGIQNRGRRMVCADKTTELWRPLLSHVLLHIVLKLATNTDQN